MQGEAEEAAEESISDAEVEAGAQPPPGARVTIEFSSQTQCWVAEWFECLAPQMRPLVEEDNEG